MSYPSSRTSSAKIGTMSKLPIALVAVLFAALSAYGQQTETVERGGKLAWCYDALLSLRESGVAVGFPDGKHSFRWPLTRYEFAVGVWATADFCRLVSDDLNYKIRMLELADPADPSTKNTEQRLSNDLNSLGHLGATETWEPLRKLLKEFE